MTGLLIANDTPYDKFCSHSCGQLNAKLHVNVVVNNFEAILYSLINTASSDLNSIH